MIIATDANYKKKLNSRRSLAESARDLGTPCQRRGPGGRPAAKLEELCV